jgi:RND family efflux transporter MFP subunit
MYHQPMIQPRTAIVGAFALLSLAGTIALANVRGPERPNESSSPASPPQADRTAESGPGPSPAGHRFLGVILARSSVDVAARFEGRLRAVHVRLGDSVPSGGPIASLDVPSLRYDLRMAEAALQTAEAEQERVNVELAEAAERFARRKALSAEALTSGEDLASARYQHKLAEARLSAVRAQLAEKRAHVEQLRQSNADAEIRAPFEGIVAARYVDPGANVTSATPIVRLISAGDLFVRFAVPEEKAATLAVGLPVRVGASDDRVSLCGNIAKVSPEIDAASRMVIVEARLDTPPAGAPVLSGEMARVSIEERR